MPFKDFPGLHSTGGKTEAQSYKYICQMYQGQEGTGSQRDSDLNTELGPGLSGSKLGQIKISQAVWIWEHDVGPKSWRFSCTPLDRHFCLASLFILPTLVR